MSEQIGDSQARRRFKKIEFDPKLNLAAQIGSAIESRSGFLEYTEGIDLAYKRTRILTGKYANHGEPHLENSRIYVEYTEAMDFADKRTTIVA